MARYDGIADQIQLQNGRPVFLQKITVGTSGAVTALSAADADGSPVVKGAMICLQADQDIFFYPATAGAASSVTTTAGAKPGMKVPQYVPFYVVIKSTDGALDCIASVAGVNLTVMVIR